MPNKEKQKGIIKRKQQNTNDELPKGTNYLLVIGIDQYEDCLPLNNAVRDVKEFTQLLVEKYHFEEENIVSLFDTAATKKGIYKALRKLTQLITANDNVVIYFSGHGEYDKLSNEGYWIPIDAENGEESDYIPNSVIRTKLGAIKSRHTFLLVDSCFSGSLLAKGSSKNVSKRYEQDPSRWCLTSGRNEIVSDGPQGTNSPFAESLLYRLRNGKDAISVQELCAHVIEYVQANSNQSPIGEPLKVMGHKNGQFVFHPKKLESQKQTIEAPTAWEQKLKALELEIARLKENQQPTQQRIITPTPHIIKDPNTFTDPRDGQTYKTVKLKDGKTWLAQNLNFDVGESCWFYDNDPKNGEEYGRLYTWEAALKACPDGWHVPSYEEWQVMAKLYGGPYLDSSDNGKSAYRALIKDGSAGFSALLGGGRYSDGDYDGLGDYSKYWSSTEHDSSLAWSYDFGSSRTLGRAYFPESLGFSCRCVQD